MQETLDLIAWRFNLSAMDAYWAVALGIVLIALIGVSWKEDKRR